MSALDFVFALGAISIAAAIMSARARWRHLRLDRQKRSRTAYSRSGRDARNREGASR